MKNYRKCIYVKDVQLITGKSESTSRKLLQTIKIKLHKKKHQFISLKEFCEFTGLPEEEVTEGID